MTRIGPLMLVLFGLLSSATLTGMTLLWTADARAVEPLPSGTHFEKWPDALIDAVESQDDETLQSWTESEDPVLSVYGAYGLALVNEPAPLCQLVESTSVIPLPAGNEIAGGVLALKLLQDLGNDGVPCLEATLSADVPEELALQAVASLKRIGTESAHSVLSEVSDGSPLALEARRAQLTLKDRLRLGLSAAVDGEKVSVSLRNRDQRPLRLIGNLSVVQSGRLGTEAAGTSCDAEEIADLENDEGVLLAPGEVLTVECLLPGAAQALPLTEVVFRSRARSGQTEPTLWNGGRLVVVADP